MNDLLTVRDLRVSFPARRGRVEAVKGIDLDLGRERLGVVGESGSGKSLSGRAILRLIRPPGRMTAKVLRFNGQDLLALPERRMRALRGARISMILQDPRFSLNPVMTVGRQIGEALKAHERLSAHDRRARAIRMLARVRIDDPERVARMYPHELSGGMGQRAMIAMMLIPRPALLIADEPTSALDVSVQAEVLELIDELVRDEGMGLILISHDLALVSRFCDRIVVMADGRFVEACAARDLSTAVHPYTRGLIDAAPRMDERRKWLPVIGRTAQGAT